MSQKCQNAKETQNHWIRQARYYSEGSARYNEYYGNAKSIDTSSWEAVREMKETEM